MKNYFYTFARVVADVAKCVVEGVLNDCCSSRCFFFSELASGQIMTGTYANRISERCLPEARRARRIK